MVSIVVLYCITPNVSMNADSNYEFKALFYERYHSEWHSKSTGTNLISEKKYNKF
jgi:hypothetical protein